MNMLPVLFAFNFSLLLLHEMDAIRAKEWKMFIFLKDMKEQAGYIVFSLIHLPLYFWVILTVSQIWSGGFAIVYLLTDIFLIAHAIIHFFFRKHSENGFNSAYSNILIYAMAGLGMIHLLLLLLGI
jgi:hypothetical protein